MPSDVTSADVLNPAVTSADVTNAAAPPGSVFDRGLLSPVTAGHDDLVADDAVLGGLVTVEVALWRALDTVRGGEASARERRSAELGWRGAGELCTGHRLGVDLDQVAREAASGGNPVIPLVRALRAGGFAEAHEGATSQDILDSALMLLAERARAQIAADLTALESALARMARERRGQTAAARTLTQHAVPTTVGLRAANWLRGIRRARLALDAALLPAQLGGAGGTLASWADALGAERAAALPAAFAAELGLAAPDAPWHTQRWPVTELGDALVQLLAALGKLATDVATLSRTEIAELAEGEPGGSSAMPQKRNPAASVLIRSAALRAPQLGATLQLAAVLAVDERPDGSWHAEWPTLRELLRLALGATAHARTLVGGLVFDDAAVARNLAMTGGALLAERGPRAGDSAPANYIGLASELAVRNLGDDPTQQEEAAHQEEQTS
ncbi:lyase family protein [Microterricola viridarii]|uniref:3-carboxy-cis,cis-muconate cycloisomerase n=1 Tax=Microterricola viridarii TaxID=412690 RepID=A0A1H1S4Y6_9MICO|nr:lyase family protein [Microterricola viridarii]SDS43062.1 3-carboxy-cis,cis-muconate cycloisomerase [Microterricola viridarii]